MLVRVATTSNRPPFSLVSAGGLNGRAWVGVLTFEGERFVGERKGRCVCWYPTGLLLASVLNSLRGMGGLTCLLEGVLRGTDGRASKQAFSAGRAQAPGRGAADQRKTPIQTQRVLDWDSVFLGINWTFRLGSFLQG